MFIVATSKDMKLESLVVIGALLTAACSINATPLGGRSLNILKYLYDRSYFENETVKIDCLVKNARSYHWYKDSIRLRNDNPFFHINGSELVIKRFTKKLEGHYTCQGKDEMGNIGKTTADLWLKTVEDPCALPVERETWCIDFGVKRCSHLIKDYPPKAENLTVQVQADVRVKPWPDIWLFLQWTVPRQGRSNFCGWQVQIIGTSEESAAFNECYQINQKYHCFDPLEEITETSAFRVPYYSSTYKVEVKSLPHLPEESDHVKNVIQKEQKTPGLCDLGNIKACCDSYTNVTLASKDNIARVNWTTHYPESLNVTIDAFVITWKTVDPINDSCSTDTGVVLDPAKSNYTFRNLTSNCGRNYTIQLKVKFTNNAAVLGCHDSPAEVVYYLVPEQEHSKEPTAGGSTGTALLGVVGFTIAAILGGIAIAALIYIYVKRSSKKMYINNRLAAFSIRSLIAGDPKEEALGMEHGTISNTQITSSSSFTGLPPDQGRLNGTSCWSAGKDDKYQWIQVDLSKEKVVTAIATQGRKNAEEWVVSYAVSYSLDREEFEDYKINGEIKVFSGNSDKNTVLTNVLSPPITTRYIRIHPQSWYSHISMRMELYGSVGPQISKKNVNVFILNSNHCDRCIQVVHALATLLIQTGHIHCVVDIFATMQEMSGGLLRWTQRMILESDYVIIPWMCEISLPKENNTCKAMDTLVFFSALDIIHAELVRNRDMNNKYIPVCLDHCSLDVLPRMQILLPTYNIPSRVDDLVIELLGKTRLQPDSRRPLLEFAHDDYTFAKRKLEQFVNSCHKKKSGAKNHNQKQSGSLYKSVETVILR